MHPDMGVRGIYIVFLFVFLVILYCVLVQIEQLL